MIDAIEYVKQRNRMCDYYVNCNDCPASLHEGCSSLESVSELVPIVEQWAKEHPVKTRQSEFLKMFPHPRLDRNGCLMICPMDAVGKEYMRDDIPGCINSELDICCEDCCRDFLLKEIE